MSRRKRSRKIRSANRRERQERVRRTINSSDLPDSVKRVVGFMISPAGQLNEEMVRIMEEKTEHGS